MSHEAQATVNGHSCYCSGTPHTPDCRLLRCADKKRAKLALDVQEPRARNSDPETSHLAAKSVRNVGLIHLAIVEVLGEWGPMTDEDLIRRYQEYHYQPRAYDSTIRTRRKELCVLGRVVEAGRKKLQSGRWGTVWAIAKEGE